MIADPDLDRFYRNVVRSATRTGNFGLAVDFARRRLDTAPNDELVPVRSELVELLRRSGDAAAELAEGRALVDQLLEQGRFEDAVQILSRLVASHNRDADLVVQLADLHHAIDDSRQAHRLYRHAVVLLQADGRTEEALHTLDQLQALKPGDRTISMARERLQQGQAIDWDALRTAIAQQNRQALATTTTPRPGSM
jgi:tetratricopeptide (TPR) repeat protein